MVKPCEGSSRGVINTAGTRPGVSDRTVVSFGISWSDHAFYISHTLGASEAIVRENNTRSTI